MRVWINGSLLDAVTTPAIRVDDHGLTVGDGVFETIKIADGRPFALSRHLRRLQHSATGLGLTELDLAQVRAGVDAVLADQQWRHGRARVTVTGGPGPMGSGRGNDGLTVLVTAAECAALAPTTTVITVPWVRNEHSAVAGLKTTSYAENVVALARAADAGASEALFANTAGHLCEGTGSNVFYVVDGELRTPALSSGCLAGVTRALVLEWVGAREVNEPIAVLERASEIFLTSTTRDVQAVSRIDDRDLPAPGPITQAAAATWAQREAESLDP